MSRIAPEWLAQQARRYMRPDARRFVREDAQRFLKPRFGPPRQAVTWKAGFDPNQPRDEFGRWTDTGASGGDGSEENPFEMPPITVTADARATFDERFGEWLWRLFEGDWLAESIGASAKVDGPAETDGSGNRESDDSNPPVEINKPSDPLSELPAKRPSTTRELNIVARLAGRLVPVVGLILEALPYLAEKEAELLSYQDPPRDLRDLQDAAFRPEKGYDIHHIVERTTRAFDGSEDARIKSSENLVRIPRWKHWDLNAWYERENERFGGMTPRAYLKGKSWDERYQVGLDGLRDVGVLK